MSGEEREPNYNFELNTNHIIKELFERYSACERILKDWNLPECKRKWFEQQREQALDGLTTCGIDRIIAIRNNGIEEEELVIFQPNNRK